MQINTSWIAFSENVLTYFFKSYLAVNAVHFNMYIYEEYKL